MITTTPNRLVRDKVVKIFTKRGATCTHEILPDMEYHMEVIKKIHVVFAEGYLISEKPEAAVLDLIETIELLYTLAKIQGVDREAMEKMVKDERDTHGGFDDRILLKTITLP
jgi:predicted house-cleaning noncanonical NTP pyrophosphatase (MazG superfamily)